MSSKISSSTALSFSHSRCKVAKVALPYANVRIRLIITRKRTWNPRFLSKYRYTEAVFWQLHIADVVTALDEKNNLLSRWALSAKMPGNKRTRTDALLSKFRTQFIHKMKQNKTKNTGTTDSNQKVWPTLGVRQKKGYYCCCNEFISWMSLHGQEQQLNAHHDGSAL